jgi:hypothetical protein
MIGEQYSANGQRQVIYFQSTRDRKAIPPALDINQPTIFFTGETEGQRPNPVTAETRTGPPGGVGPIPGMSPGLTPTSTGELLGRVPLRVAGSINMLSNLKQLGLNLTTTQHPQSH